VAAHHRCDLGHVRPAAARSVENVGDLVEEYGGVWREDAARAMIGMSSVEWSRHMHDELRVDLQSTELTTSTPTRRCCG